MTDDNSTGNQPSNITSKAVGLPDAFFDPAWQLALTVEFYFKYAVLAIGIFGTAANALVLYALVVHHTRDVKKRAINLLIINQNLLDLSCCLLLVMSVSVQINNPRITAGTLGYFLCGVFLMDNATYSALYGSIINLVALTIERYLKVVHPFWSKKHLKRWMIHAAMAFAWIGGVVSIVPPAILTTKAQDGICLSYFDTPESDWIMGGCTLAIFFLLPLIIFVYCYGRIVVVMRRQMRVMAGHNVEGTSAQTTASQAQSKRVIVLHASASVSDAFLTLETINHF